MELSIFIIDDEPSSIETLKAMLTEYFPGTKVCGTCNTIADAPNLLELCKPDLVFLDVEMPGGSGFDVLKKKYLHDFEVVITTAYSDYALKAFQFNALHYIMKPIDRQELCAALNKAKQRVTEKRKIAQQPPLYHSSLKKLAVPTLEGVAFIDIEDITRCTARDNYTEVFLAKGERIMVSRTLREFEEALEQHHFIRTHNSFLVNLMHIIKYSKSGYLTMSDGSIVEVSKRKRHAFLEKFALLGHH